MQAPRAEDRPAGSLPADALVRPTHLATLFLGFVLGVFLVYVLRNEIRSLTALRYKFSIMAAATVVVALFLLPLYGRLARALVVGFGPLRGAALLQLVNFLLWALGSTLFLLAGLYFMIVI